MALDSLLSVEQIIPDMNATERWPAIVELIDLLVRLGKINPDARESKLYLPELGMTPERRKRR